MAQPLGELFEACSSLKSSLLPVVNPDERHDKIVSFIQDTSSKQQCIGDFAVGLEWFNCAEPLSLGWQLRGKIVILDFFTYCCINCLHILPHLRKLEEKIPIEEGVAVIGVHSAKFDNEKDSANISAALRRYNVSHPVVNDSEGLLWTKLGISCWPTLLILGPQGQPLFQLIGEGHEKDLFEFVGATVKFFGSRGELSSHSLPITTSKDTVLKGPLLFPGKVTSIASDNGTEMIAISNTGLHSIIIITSDGKVKHVVGCSGQPGFKDGDFQCALFNAPQGIAFSSCDSLFVADTENHAIRMIDLKNKCVLTIAGNGQQGFEESRGNIGGTQSLSSPWDLCVVRRRVPVFQRLPQPFLCICPAAPPGYKGLNEEESVDPPPPPPVAPSAPGVLNPPPPPPPPPVAPSAPGILNPPPLPPPPPVAPSAPGILNPPPLPPPPPVAPSAPGILNPPPLPPPPPVALSAPGILNPPPPPPPPVAPSVPGILGPPPPPVYLQTQIYPLSQNEEEETEEQEILFIAMAGCHQIWALFLQDTVWLGKEYFSAGTCVSIAGSGMEANRNNSYPRSASFAQPSGLTYCFERDELMIADSESSSIRSINLKTGKVSAVVGGSKVPDDLFCFGDVDGESYNVKLQHPLGVVWHEESKSLFVADSYNHKIKMIKLDTMSCSSFIGDGHAGNLIAGRESQLNEPGGLSISADQSKLYIADTNNHCVKVFDITSSTLSKLNIRKVSPTINTNSEFVKTEAPIIRINNNGKIIFHIDTELPPDVKLTDGAPQRWVLKLPDGNWKAEPTSGIFNPLQTLTVVLDAPFLETPEAADANLQLSAKLFVCVGGVCKAANTALTFSIVHDCNAPSVVDYYSSFHVL